MRLKPNRLKMRKAYGITPVPKDALAALVLQRHALPVAEPSSTTKSIMARLRLRHLQTLLVV
jgi:hypothetical protein